MRNAVIAVVLGVWSTPILRAQTVLTVEVAGRRSELTASELARLPHDTVSAAFHQQPARLYSAVPVHAILAAAGVRADSLRGAGLRRRVVVEAADGYRVVLSLAECDPSLADRRVLLADAVDGQPLPGNEGPLRLLMTGDPRHSRWARQVTALRVRDEDP